MYRLLMGSCFALLFGIADRVSADPPSSSTQTVVDGDRAAALVRLLGDPKFRVRESAARELLTMGTAAVSALQKGLTDADPEIADRCRTLLPIAARSDLERRLAIFLNDTRDEMKPLLGGWKHFCSVAGNDRSSRDLYAEMYRNYYVVLEELERDPKKINSELRKRVQDAFQRMYGPNGVQPGAVDFEEILGFVFLGSLEPITIDQNTFSYLTNLFYQQVAQQGFRNNPIAKKVLMQFLERRSNDLVALQNIYHLALNMGLNDFVEQRLKPNARKALIEAAKNPIKDPNTLQQVLYAAQSLDLKEGLELALKAVEEKKLMPWARGQALILISKWGNKEHIKLLEPLLTDKTSIGGFGINNVRGETQLRDAALGIILHLHGEKLADFGFAYFEVLGRQFAPHQTSAGCLGFADQSKREAAFKKYEEKYKKKE